MVKKVGIVVILLIAIFFGLSYFAGASSNKEIDRVISNDGKNEIIKKEVKNGFFESDGKIVAKVKKEEIANSIEKLIYSLPSLTQEQKQSAIADMRKDISNIKDIDFEYNYKTKHSLLNVAGGFESEGSIKILTPFYKDILKNFIKDDEILKLKLNKKLSSLDSELEFADISFITFLGGIIAKDLKVTYTLTDSEESIKKAGISFDNFTVEIPQTFSIDIKDFDTKLEYDKPLSLNSSFISFFINNYKADTDIKKISFYLKDKGDTIEGFIKDLKDRGEYTLDGSKVTNTGKLEIEDFKFGNFKGKNLKGEFESKFHKIIYEAIFNSSIDDLLSNQIAKEIEGEEMVYNVKNFSFENDYGDKAKLSFDSAFKLYSDEDKMLKSIKFLGNAHLSSSEKEFLRDLDDSQDWIGEFRDLGIWEKDGKGLKSEFKFDVDNLDVIFNGKTSLKSLQ